MGRISGRIATTASTASGGVVTKISCGNGWRVLWTEGDGDGQYDKHTIDRLLGTVNGHPAWKLYCGEPTEGIIRGLNEPPRYVYLDDRACYDVLRSKSYCNKELRLFWPFDFDNMGNIKTKRPNRGNPAYVDDSCLEYAKGPLRGGSEYEFSGAPEASQVSAPPVKVEAKKVDVKPSTRIALCGALPPALVIPSPLSHSDHSAPSTPSTTGPLTPAGTPLGDTSSIYPIHPRWTSDTDPLSNARLKFEQIASNHYVSGPVDGTLKPLGMPPKAMQGSAYFDAPASDFRTAPRQRSGDMSHIVEKMKAAGKRGRVVAPIERETAPETQQDTEQDNEREAKKVKIEGVKGRGDYD
jgi:hypothetical protein